MRSRRVFVSAQQLADLFERQSKDVRHGVVVIDPTPIEGGAFGRIGLLSQEQLRETLEDLDREQGAA